MSFVVQSYPEKVILSDNPAKIVISIGPKSIYYADAIIRRLHVQIFNPYINEYYLPFAEDSFIVQENQVITMDISEYLRNDTRKQFILSDLFVTDIIDAGLTSEYTFKFFETYDSYNQPWDAIISTNFFAINGGLSRALLQYYDTKGYTFLSKLIGTENRFLSWQMPKKLMPTQIEMLYYLNTLLAELKYQFVLSFDDATTQTITSAAITATEWTVYTLNASFFAHQLEQYEIDKLIVSFDFYVLGGSGVTFEQVSETKTYTIDRSYMHFARQFIFHNSLGGYDCVLLHGLSEVENKFNRESGISDEGQNRVFFVNYDSEKTTNSGWMNSKYTNAQRAQDYMTELLLSEEVYEAYKNHIVEIIPQSDSLKVYQDKNYLFSFEFKYKTAYNEGHYSDFLETPFLGIPQAKFRCQDAEYNTITELFSLTIVRTDTFELIDGVGEVVLSTDTNPAIVKVYPILLDVGENTTITLDLSAYCHVSRVSWTGSCSGELIFDNGKLLDNSYNCLQDNSYSTLMIN